MNRTGWRNDEKRVKTVLKQINAAAAMCVPHEQLREPSLKFFKGQKKSIMELAAICGLVYRDGRVG
jgi:hypothetical protein